MEELEEDLRAHAKQWEALQAASAQDSSTISHLCAAKDQLEQEVEERREAVKHLEGLLQEVWHVIVM